MYETADMQAFLTNTMAASYGLFLHRNIIKTVQEKSFQLWYTILFHISSVFFFFFLLLVSIKKSN